MNTSVRTATASKSDADTRPIFGVIILALLVLISAFAVVYITDLNRRLFIQLQEAQALQNQLYVDWGKLLLEQSTWSTQARVQNIAQQRLNMEVPTNDQMVVIKPNK